MKANLFVLSMLTLSISAHASEMLYLNDGQTYTFTQVASTKTGEAISENDKDMKIATLAKLLDQQQRLYDEKVNYLEYELQKAKERLVEKSINHDKMQAILDKRYLEESTFLKKELITKTKTLMEYQRQLEKIKPSEDMKNLIKVNTDLAVELRKSADQIALMQLKGVEIMADKNNVAPERKPASLGK